MELKLQSDAYAPYRKLGSNRTFMELKCLFFSAVV